MLLKTIFGIVYLAKVDCKYKGLMRIGDKEWEWCFLFNAKIEDLNCEKCRHKTSAEKDFPPKNLYLKGVSV